MTQSSVMSKHGTFAWQPSTTPSTTGSFPFVAELSLQPLVTFWQQSLHGEAAAEGAFAAQLQVALQQCPALLAPIADMALLAPHQALLDRLMQVIIPQAAWEDVYSRLNTLPFAEFLRHPLFLPPVARRAWHDTRAFQCR